MRWKWGSRRGALALCSLAALMAPAKADSSAVNYVAVYSHSVSELDRSQFPVSRENGFGRVGNSLGLSMDGETAGVSWRVRALVSKDDANGAARQFRIKELNKVWTVSDTCRLSAGKRILAWDVGYLTQPVGFFQTQSVLTDLVDVAGNSEGLPLVLFSCGVGSGLALDLVRSDDLGERADFQNRGLHQSVIRLSGHHGNAAYAILARRVNGQGNGAGATFSTTLGETLEVHASAYAHHGATRLMHQGVSGTQAPQFWQTSPYAPLAQPGFESQALLGMTWTPSKLPALTLEVAHDDRGLSDAEWQRWKSLRAFHQTAPAPGQGLRTGNLLWDLETIRAQGTRRDYAYLQLQQSWPGIAVSVGNEWSLNDSSTASFVSLSKTFSRKLATTLSLSHFSAGNGTEFAYFPIRNAMTFRLVASY